MALVAAVMLLGTACSGGADGTSPPSDAATSAAPDAGTSAAPEAGTSAAPDTAEEPTGGGGGGCPVDACDEALLPELAGIPMPGSVEAYAYGTTDRSDGLAVQQVFLGGSVDEAAEFYDTALTDAGFEVTFRFAEGDDYAVDFTDPEGRPGSISIGPREFHPLVMDVGLEVG